MRIAIATTIFVLATAPANARGLLIPNDKTTPPLSMVRHHVQVTIEDQVAITTVEQSFRNHTSRNLEATYVFPVPSGANVNQFSMWIDGSEVKGELLKADEARRIYTDIVRRTQDPALLEYIDGNLLRMRVFPIPPNSDQKVKLSFTSISRREGETVEYVYPLRSEKQPIALLEGFSIKLTLKSQKPLGTIYSPSHAIDIVRDGDQRAEITFERAEANLNRDFQLFYGFGDGDIGMTTLTHRPISSEDGYFMLAISPRMEMSREQRVPRDVVLILDTSGSMDGVKMSQARQSLRHILTNLDSRDRFGLVSFATSVRAYRDELMPVEPERITQATKWVNDLQAGGGTAIQPALDMALRMRSDDTDRSFTLIFFTDGQPTIGEMKPEAILKNTTEKAGERTRIFTFGVGDDVNTALLDQLADRSRAVSTYVRPAEDIATKTEALYAKISHPVLTDLHLSTSENVTLHEIYPPRLPDLFHGGQLIVFGRYSGTGNTDEHATLTLKGTFAGEEREFVNEATFPARTEENHAFVEDLWARRKVGYLLDQIRANGEQKELMDELITLAKRYGIATPYTSYLVVPDAPLPSPIVRDPVARPMPMPIPPGLIRGGEGALTEPVLDFARRNQARPGEAATNRARIEADQLEEGIGNLAKDAATPDALQTLDALKRAKKQSETFERSRELLRQGNYRQAQTGELGVDLALSAGYLRDQKQLDRSATRYVQGRNCLEVGGVWIDENFAADQRSVVIKAQSDAYFRILERRPEMKDVFKLGNHLVFVTPSHVALIIDAGKGQESIPDTEIDALFVASK